MCNTENRMDSVIPTIYVQYAHVQSILRYKLINSKPMH